MTDKMQPSPKTSEEITGGVPSAVTPWIVQLWLDNKFWCTANMISSQWILTARHAILDYVRTPDRLRIYVANQFPPPRNSVVVTPTRVIAAPDTDMGVLQLGQALLLPETGYAPLADKYKPTLADSGYIYGFGWGATGTEPQSLRQALVSVSGVNLYGKDGPTVMVQGVTGASMPGDSGGPLMIDGKLVGTLSTGRSQGEIHSTSYYANITASRAWIRSTTGV